MTTIPAKKFEEWIDEYRFAEKQCNNRNSCDKCEIIPVACNLDLYQYLSIKSKEYMEANQC